jgi:hypothetical protein
MSLVDQVAHICYMVRQISHNRLSGNVTYTTTALPKLQVKLAKPKDKTE